MPAVRRSFVGHGVLFPESPFAYELPSVESDLIFDDSDLARPMSAYVDRLDRVLEATPFSAGAVTRRMDSTARRGR